MTVLGKLQKKGKESFVSTTTSIRFRNADLARIDSVVADLGVSRSSLVVESTMDVVAQYERQQTRDGGK